MPFAMASMLTCFLLAWVPLQAAEDHRDEEPRNLNGYFPFEVPASTTAWSQQAEERRQQLLVANGLWPMPTRTPLNAVIHGKLDQGDYTVEKVYMLSLIHI